MSKRAREEGVAACERARVRGKEGDFFSSCKPFQLCSGLRTETGSERKKEGKKERSFGAHTSHIEKEGEKTEEELGLRGTLFQSQCGLRSRRKKTAKKRAQREGGKERVLGLSAGGERGEDAACKAKLRLKPGGLSGSLPSGYSPTTHCSAPARLPARLAGPGSTPPAPPFLLYLPPDALFRCSLTPSEILPAFDLLYHLSPLELWRI